MAPDLPLLAYADQRRSAEFTRAQKHAASGLDGSVAARKVMKALRTEQLRADLSNERAVER